MTSRFQLSKPLISATLLALALGGCAGQTKLAQPVIATSLVSASLALEGTAMVAAGLIANNGSSIISQNAGSLVSNNGGGLITDNGSGFQAYGLLSLDEAPLASALAYLTTPDEKFYKFNGKMISTTTDSKGRYRFSGGVPRKQPVIVNVVMSENRRVVGFAVPDSGTTRVDVSVASTYVTEFLRLHADIDDKTMADYDLTKLADLAARTERALDAEALAIPDLKISHLVDMTNAYALAIGRNLEGLGNAWASVLGYRTIAGITVAGSGISDSGGDGKPALQGEFYRLKGVVTDQAGNMFIADEGNHRVRRVDAKTGLLSTVAGSGDRGFAGDGGPATKAKFNFPRAVLLDRAENLYVFDSQNLRIRRIDKATGVITTFAGDPPARGDGFWENGHGGDGGPAAKAQFFSPRGGAFDSQGNLYVSDGLKGTDFHTIRKITPTGEISTFAGAPNTPGAFVGENVLAENARFNYTNQLFMAPDDQLYVADTLNDCVRKIDLSTRLVTTVAGLGGKRADQPERDGMAATETRLNQPYGVAVDADGQVFISERGFNRVLVIKPNGKLYSLAGGGTFTGNGDARLLAFSEPHDLWLEPGGHLLMADSRSGKLRRLLVGFGI